MRFLVDTNIWLELLLEQERAQEVRRLFEERDGAEFAITEFSLYSMGIALTRLRKDEAFSQFIAGTLDGAGTRLVRLDSSQMNDLLRIRKRFGLDFDDAYQYTAAEKYDLILLSFDADDRTERGRKTPAMVISST